MNYLGGCQMSMTKRESLQVQMVLSLASAVLSMRSAVINLVDSPAFDDTKKAEFLRRNSEFEAATNELFSNIEEFKRL